MAVLAVHGHEVPRVGELQHALQILLARVAGDVDERVVIVEHLGAETIERVDHAADRALVAGNDARGDDDEIATRHLHVLVLAGGHERERGVRLALAAGRQNDLLRRRQRHQLFQRAQQSRRQREVAELGGDGDVLLHRAAEQRHVTAAGSGQREHLLDAMDVRGERGQDDAPGGRVEALGQRRADLDLRARVTGSVDVRGVRAEHGHALLAELGEARGVGWLAVERARIELEVARVDDHAGRGADGQAHAIGDGVRHADRLDRERPEHERCARPHRAQVRLLVEAVLAQLLGHQCLRQWRRVDRDAGGFEQVGQRADVVLVTVREDDGAEAVALGERVGKVGNDVVDSRQLVVGKHEAAIDGDHVIATLDEHHVQPDLAEAAERDEPDCLIVHERKPVLSAYGGHGSTRPRTARILPAASAGAKTRRRLPDARPGPWHARRRRDARRRKWARRE